MEVVIPSPSMTDFNFDSSRSSHYVTSTSTPRRFGDYYFSTPTSPTHVSEFYRDFNEFVVSAAEGTSSSVPFEWEERPGTPKSGKNGDEFAFDFSAERENKSLSAEELFDGGVIRPLKLPPRLQSPRSPRMLKSPVLSPKSQKQRRQSSSVVDPFEAAIENTRKQSQVGIEREVQRERGRERLQSSNSVRRTARSHSPLRVSAYPWEEDRGQLSTVIKQKSSFSSSKSSVSSSSSKKWSFKDLLLFRSASEGSATDKNHPFRKYSGIFRRQEEVKHSSFRSDSGRSGSISRRRGPVSAHELHYTVNKAVSEDLKKKTFLPYKQGILGRLSFNPAVHALTNGFGSFYRKHNQ